MSFLTTLEKALGRPAAPPTWPRRFQNLKDPSQTVSVSYEGVVPEWLVKQVGEKAEEIFPWLKK